MNIGIIIPARYHSTRLPGKPLIDLCGKSMIQRTWERCVQALEVNSVWVATDSNRIKEHVEGFGGQVVMTSSDCLTGTDRLAEANEILNLDLVVNVQGDEPIINPLDILKVIEFSIENPDYVVNGIAPIKDESEFESLTIPKVAKNLNDELLYMSRNPIPGSKDNKLSFAFKQICIYSFPKEELRFYSKVPTKSPYEEVEDIEIMRLVEHGHLVKLVELSGDSRAVDVEADVDAVLSILNGVESDQGHSGKSDF